MPQVSTIATVSCDSGVHGSKHVSSGGPRCRGMRDASTQFERYQTAHRRCTYLLRAREEEPHPDRRRGNGSMKSGLQILAVEFRSGCKHGLITPTPQTIALCACTAHRLLPLFATVPNLWMELSDALTSKTTWNWHGATAAQPPKRTCPTECSLSHAHAL